MSGVKDLFILLHYLRGQDREMTRSCNEELVWVVFQRNSGIFRIQLNITWSLNKMVSLCIRKNPQHFGSRSIILYSFFTLPTLLTLTQSSHFQKFSNKFYSIQPTSYNLKMPSTFPSKMPGMIYPSRQPSTRLTRY